MGSSNRIAQYQKTKHAQLIPADIPRQDDLAESIIIIGGTYLGDPSPRGSLERMTLDGDSILAGAGGRVSSGWHLNASLDM